VRKGEKIEVGLSTKKTREKGEQSPTSPRCQCLLRGEKKKLDESAQSPRVDGEKEKRIDASAKVNARAKILQSSVRDKEGGPTARRREKREEGKNGRESRRLLVSYAHNRRARKKEGIPILLRICNDEKRGEKWERKHGFRALLAPMGSRKEEGRRAALRSTSCAR